MTEIEYLLKRTNILSDSLVELTATLQEMHPAYSENWFRIEQIFQATQRAFNELEDKRSK